MRADYDLYVVLIGNSQCVSKKTDGQIDQLSRPFYRANANWHFPAH